MKRLKFTSSFIIIALFVAILVIGIYAASPASNTIIGTITVTSANARVKVETFLGQIDNDHVLATTLDSRLGGTIAFNRNLTFVRKSAYVESVGREGLQYSNGINEVEDLVIIFRVTNYSTKDLGLYYSNETITKQLDEVYDEAEALVENSGQETVDSKVKTSLSFADGLVTATMNAYLPLAKSTTEAITNESGLSTTNLMLTLKLTSLVEDLTNVSISGLYLNIEGQSSHVTNVVETSSESLTYQAVGGSALGASIAKGSVAPTGDFIIPEYVSVGGSVRRLTTIGNNAFFGCSGLTGNIVIPDSVTTIGNSAFSSCSGFNGTLTIGKNVTTIDNSAFSSCSGLVGDLTIPDNVTTIGSSAFSSCSKFNGTLTIGKNVTSISEYAFSDCNKLVGNLIIPDSVTTIGNGAFSSCSGFDGTLTIGKNVTSIGESAFRRCSNLIGDLIIPSGVSIINYQAFQECNKLNGRLFIPNGVTSIGQRAFGSCIALTGSLTIPDTVLTIGNSAFVSCVGFSGSLVIPNSVTSIGSNAFNNCSGFNGTLTLGDHLITIGNEAFYRCRNLVGPLTIPDSVTTIGNSAFYECTGFSGSLYIGLGVTSIGSYAFNTCRGLTGSVVIPNGVTSIGERAFSGCNGITSVTIPASVSTIGNFAFYCYRLVEVYNFSSVSIVKGEDAGSRAGLYALDVYDQQQPSKLSSIQGVVYWYDGVKKLAVGVDSLLESSYIISSDCTGIHDYAFYYCENLVSITIPATVSTIGYGSFGLDTSNYGSICFNSVTFENTVGWKVYTDAEHTLNATSVSSSNLQTGSPIYLYDFYCWRYWQRT